MRQKIRIIPSMQEPPRCDTRRLQGCWRAAASAGGDGELKNNKSGDGDYQRSAAGPDMPPYSHDV